MTVATQPIPDTQRNQATLRDATAQAVRRYLSDLNGSECQNLYGLMLRQVELPLLEEALRHCDGNMTRTADLLGINRATLRKKLADHGISS